MGRDKFGRMEYWMNLTQSVVKNKEQILLGSLFSI
jgi:hypothetical protein